MEKLTAQQKLSVVREARKLYIESLKGGDPVYYRVVCSSLGFALENQGLVDYSWNCNLVQEMLPELMQYKPLELADKKNDIWWPREDTKTRLEVFNALEQEFLPWYTKLYNQIKNLFK